MERVDELQDESLERVKTSGEDAEAAIRRSAAVLMLFDAEGVPEHDPARDAKVDDQRLGRRSSRRPRPLRAVSGD